MEWGGNILFISLMSQILIKFINFNYLIKFNVNRGRNMGRKYRVHFFERLNIYKFRRF